MKPITLHHADLYTAATFSPSVGRPDLTTLTEWIHGPSQRTPEADVLVAHPAPWAAGDVLWAREHTAEEHGTLYGGDCIFAPSGVWRPPSRMPRKLARIFLRVTASRLTCGPSPLLWAWRADVAVVRDRHGKLCAPGPDAVWRGAFHAALSYDDMRAERVALDTLAPMIAAQEWGPLREHLLTFASTWMRASYNGLAVTRAVMKLMRPHRAMVGDAWEALVAKERAEAECS